jgi:hypothetical protein
VRQQRDQRPVVDGLRPRDLVVRDLGLAMEGLRRRELRLAVRDLGLAVDGLRRRDLRLAVRDLGLAVNGLRRRALRLAVRDLGLAVDLAAAQTLVTPRLPGILALLML